jgi:hypothetical protein
VAGVVGTGWRLASLAAPRGLERVLATASLAGGIAVLEELGLGLVGAGGGPWTPVAAAVATWAVALVALPRPQIGALEEVARWWGGMDPVRRAGLGALAGLALASAAGILYRPAIGYDNSLYHYVEALAWVHNGHPGSIVRLSYDYPFGSYPLTNEVLLTWGTATARSFAPMELWVLAPLLLLGLALWRSARLLEIRPLAAGAIVAFVLGLARFALISEATNDAAMLAWAMTALALSLASVRRPGLLAPALVAGGLAIGTKTSPLLLVAVALGTALWVNLDRLRLLAIPLTAAGAAALALSLPWYARNLFQHGTPVWPFQKVPWGDPVPPFLKLVDVRFLERPVATVLHDPHVYLVETLAGALVVVAGALLAPAVSRRRDVRLATGLFVAMLLLWALAPGTGLPRDPHVFERLGLPVSATRYMYPALAVGALTIGMVARERGVRRHVATAVLLIAAAWCWIVAATSLDSAYVARPGWLLVGALAGAGLALVSARLRSGSAGRPRAIGVVATLALILGLAGGAAAVGRNFTGRNAITVQDRAVGHDRVNGRPSLIEWFESQPAWRDGDDAVYLASRWGVAALAGDRVQHAMRLLAPDSSCVRLRRQAQRGWIVTSDPVYGYKFSGVRDYGSAACFNDRVPVFDNGAFRVYRNPGTVRAS